MASQKKDAASNRRGGSLIGKGIVKRFGKKEVLHGIDIALEPGRIYGLIGRNGAGKTTLLSILSAQNPLSLGEVTLAGEQVWENIPAKEQICFSRELTPTAESGIANLKIQHYLKIAASYFPNWDQPFAMKLLGDFQLYEKAKIGKLSKGMLSMITIIVALASKAPYTFLDEPVAGLDVIAREEFYRLLLEEYSATGRTFVVSTHIIEEAAAMLEETIILKDGHVLLQENTEELVASCIYVSGREEEVEQATVGLDVYHKERIGRSVGAMVKLADGQELRADGNITIQPMSLQKIFAALCQEEREER